MSTQQAVTALGIVFEFMQYAERFQAVEGFLHPLEGYTLMTVAGLSDGEGEVVEVGSFKGRSTCWLAAGLNIFKRGRVTAIDHFRGSPEHQPGQPYADAAIATFGSTLPVFEQNLKAQGLWDLVNPVIASSLDAAASWSRPVRVLFIDGHHSYEATRADFEAWQKFIISGGLVCFHDVTHWDGVTRFYDELLARQPQAWRQIISVESLRVVQRVL